MTVFIADSNFFIEAHRKTYPLDIAFSFWNKVKQLAEAGVLISIDKVRDELYQHNDALKEWCINNLPDDFFRDSSEVAESYVRVAGWALSGNTQYLQKAIDEFLGADEADAFIIAFALADIRNRIVLTCEVSAPCAKSKIKIPDVCIAFDIVYLDTMGMFRQLSVTF